jgi:hypothetical protein
MKLDDARRLSARTLALLLATALRAPAQEPEAIKARYAEIATRITAAALLKNDGYARLEELCDGVGSRLSGSPGMDRAIKWAESAMRRAGLDEVRLQPCRVPTWRRGEALLELLRPRREALPLLALGGSVPTPKGGLTADAVVVRSFAELDALPREGVEGRIVVFDVPYEGYGKTVQFRSLGASRAARKGAVAALVRSAGFGGNRTPHTGALRYEDDAPKIPAAALAPEDSAMLGRLAAAGAAPRLTLELSCSVGPDAPSANVIGRYRGRETPEEYLVVSGHLDSWDVGQGAQDDGGGCVSVLEAVAVLNRLRLRPRRSIDVVFFTNEENGLRGAHAYRDEVAKNPELCVGAYENDGGVERPTSFLITYPSGESRPSRRAAPDSRPSDPATARRFDRFAATVERVHGLACGVAGLGGGGADIGPLLDLGIPTLSPRTVGTRYFEWHHTAGDTLDKVDREDLDRHIAAQAALFYIWADLDERL